MKKCVFAGVAFVLSVVVAACGGSNGQSAGNASSGGTGSSKSYAELRWGSTPFPGTLDETKVAYGQTYGVESLAVQDLMEFEPDGKIKPGLASSVEQPNPTTYVYHLRSVKFSDGKPMTSADVVYSLDRNITGKEAWTKSFWEDVASVTAPNSSVVIVKLKRPLAVFQKIVAFSGAVIEKAAAEKDGEKAIGTPGHMPIGTGPWKIDSFTPESSVRLSRNPHWSGPQQPAADIKVEFFKTEASMALALRSGAIDGASNYYSPKPFANIPGVRQMSSPGEGIGFVSVNTQRAPFNDVHVRRALAYATDSKGMVDALFTRAYAGEAPFYIPNSLFSTLGSRNEVNQMLASLPKFEFNLVKAKEELARSAYPHGFTMHIEVPQGSPAYDGAGQILASDFAKIGIKAVLHENTKAEEARGYTGKGTFFINLVSANYPDPDSILGERLSSSQIYPSGGGENSSNWRNARFDKLLAQAEGTLNAPRRLQMIGDLLRIVRNEAPAWALFSVGNYGSLSSKYVMPGFSLWTVFATPWAMDVKLAH